MSKVTRVEATTVKAASPEKTGKGGVKAGRDYGLDMLWIISICGVVAIHVFGLRVGSESKEGRGWWSPARSR